MSFQKMQTEVGPTLSSRQVAELFGIDARTVRKHATLFGGVEVAPGRYRFFESQIRKKYAHILGAAR